MKKATITIATLIAIATALNLPERFTDDLYVHDANRLASTDAPTTFGWVLRVSGTELLDARMGREYANGYRRHYTSGDGDTTNRYYWANDGKISEVTMDAMFMNMRDYEENSDTSLRRRIY